jgi:hypothetical protein
MIFDLAHVQVFPRLIGNKDLILNFANPGSPNPTSVYANKTRLALFAFNQSPLQVVYFQSTELMTNLNSMFFYKLVTSNFTSFSC